MWTAFIGQWKNVHHFSGRIVDPDVASSSLAEAHRLDDGIHEPPLMGISRENVWARDLETGPIFRRPNMKDERHDVLMNMISVVLQTVFT